MQLLEVQLKNWQLALSKIRKILLHESRVPVQISTGFSLNSSKRSPPILKQAHIERTSCKGISKC